MSIIIAVKMYAQLIWVETPQKRAEKTEEKKVHDDSAKFLCTIIVLV